MSRLDEIATGLDSVRRRIDSAAREAGRQPDEVALVVVTKTWPAADVRLLADLGVRDVGENRDQEARSKALECSDLPVRWHFVGRLQRNKAGSVATYADYVHSVDREPLCEALDRGAGAADRILRVFVQVDLGSDTSPPETRRRGGALPTRVKGICQAARSAANLELTGLMAVAPLGENPASVYDRLNRIRQSVLVDFPEARGLSAGMSSDLEVAVAAGATHVRVGTAVLGDRTYVR